MLQTAWTFLTGIATLAVAVAALILNVFYIRLAKGQLANVQLERDRLIAEIDKLRIEAHRLREV